MKYLKLIKKGETAPTELESGVLYYNENTEKVSCKVEPKVPEGYVDLGLSVYWAKCNVGATSETDYGLLFQWGDTVGYADASHSTWSTAPFNNGSSNYDEGHFSKVSGAACPNGVLAAQYDAASVATDGVAHMPTQEQLEELTANTTVERVTDFNGSGVNGRKFTASNGNYIFIPASGSANNGSVNNRGSSGYVWSSSLAAGYPNGAWLLRFSGSNVGVNLNGRYSGFSVRGVVSK